MAVRVDPRSLGPIFVAPDLVSGVVGNHHDAILARNSVPGLVPGAHMALRAIGPTTVRGYGSYSSVTLPHRGGADPPQGLSAFMPRSRNQR